MNAAGEVTLAQDYEPYGEVLGAAGSGTTRYGFTGEWTDSYIESINLRSRYYSPATGRFYTKDTWQGDYTKPLSLNAWLYVGANPINFADPSGLCAEAGWDDPTGLFTKTNCDLLELDLAQGTTVFTESWYRQLASRERSDGLDQAATNLEHYLNGSGTELTLPESFVQNTITVAMPKINDHVNDLVNWYIKKNFNSLAICQPTSVGPDTYAWLINTPNYFGITLGGWKEQLDVAAALGSFRVDVELSGSLHRKKYFLWLSNIDAQLDVHIIMFDVYNWNVGQFVYYPPYLNGNQILDDWAANLETNGTARSYVIRGDYTYRANRYGVGGPGWFFDPNSPPSDWVLTSCIGSQFDIDAEGPGAIDYCGNPMR